MIIEVTQNDIDNAKRRDITCCPVALASARFFKKNTWFFIGVTVDYSLIRIVRKFLGNKTYIIPTQTYDKIKEYDKTGKMTPFKFFLIDYI